MVKETDKEETKQKAWLIRKWKLVLLFLLAFMLSLIIFIPYFYSNRIFQPIIKDTFRQLTHDKYSLDFENVKWNILKSSFSVHDILVTSSKGDSTKVLANNTIEILELKQIFIKGIDYSSLISGQVKFRYLEIDGLDVQLNKDKANDTLVKHVEPKKPISKYFSSILIQQMEIKHFNASFLNENESVFVANNMSLSLNSFYLDSLDFIIDYRKPSFDSINMVIGESDFHGEESQILLSGFAISAGQQFKSPNLIFSKLKLVNNKNANTLLINNGEIYIVLENLFNSFQRHDFYIPELKIHCGLLKNETAVQKKVDINFLIENLQKEIEKMQTKVVLDSLFVEIDTIISYSPLQNISLAKLNFQLYKSQIKEGEYNYGSYNIKTGKLNLLLNKNHKKLGFKSSNYKEATKSIMLTKITYYDSSSSLSFTSNNIDIYKLDLLFALRNKKANMEKLSLNMPQFFMFKEPLKTKNTSVSKIGWDINIKEIELHKFDVELKYLGLKLNNADLVVDSLMLFANEEIHWSQTIKNFELAFDNIDYNPFEKDLNASLGRSSFKSLRGQFSTQEFAVAINKKDEIQAKATAKQVFFSGVDWRVLLKKSSPVILDTLLLDNLVIDASFFQTANTKSNSSNTLFNFEAKYIDLDNIQLDILMQHQKAQIHFNDLNINAHNFSVNLSDKEFLHYQKLDLSALNTSYSKAEKAINFNVNKWSFNMSDHIFKADGIKVSANISDTLNKSNAHIDFALPSVYISGIKPMSYLLEKTLLLDSVNLYHPNILYNEVKKGSLKSKKPSQNYLGVFQVLTEKFKAVGFNHFIVSNIKLNIQSQHFNKHNEIEIGSVDLGIQGFYIDDEILNKKEKFLFSNDFSLHLNDYVQSINHGQHIVSLKELLLSKSANELSFNQFRLMSLNGLDGTPINAFVKDAVFKQFNLEQQKTHPALSIANVNVNTLEFLIQLNKKKNNKKVNLEEIDLYLLISKYLSSFKIDELLLSKADLSLYGIQIANQKSLNISGIELQANALLLDSNNRAFTANKFFYCDRILLDLPKFKMKSKDRLYDIGFNKISFNSQLKTLEIDSLKIDPIYDKKLFSAYLKYQKDRIEMFVPKVNIDHFDLQEILFEKKYNIKKMTILEPDIAFYKDKTVAKDTSALKLMPAQMLAEIPFYLNIDTIELVKGRLQYEELSNNMPQPGFVYLDKLNGQLTGITNDAKIQKTLGYLKLAINAQFMSKAMLTLNSSFSFNSANQDFTVIAAMGPIQFSEFNPLIQPLALFSAKDGSIAQMQMNVHGNSEYGVGNMILKYSDLKIEVLKKKNLEESQLGSFLANTVFLKSKNKSIFGPRKGPIYFERVKYRGIINYISHFAIMGAKTSIGIDTRKTKRKIKSVRL